MADVEPRLRDWAAAAGYRAAPPLHYLRATTVEAAARAEMVVDPGTSDNYFRAALLRALEGQCGSKVLKAKAPFAKATGNTDPYWGVTCDRTPAAPMESPAWSQEGRPMKDKKARRVAWRRERGIPDPDPKRNHADRNCSHFRKSASHCTMYTDELLGLTSAPQMLELKLFPSAKELTESFACFNAARAHLSHFRSDDPSVLCVVVGDGLTPRTAGLFAYRTRWTCVSIDPLLQREAHWMKHIERLTAIASTVQDAAPEGKFASPRVLLVLPHAHVGLDECLQYVRWRQALGAIVMPCCNWYLGAVGCGPPLHEADDLGVISPHRQLSVWEWVPGDKLPEVVPPPDDTIAADPADGAVAELTASAGCAPCVDCA